MDSKLNFSLKNGLLFMGSHLVVPKYKDIWEQLFRLAHNHLGHFGGEKSYALLRDKFYWLNTRRDLVSAYIPGCGPCQQNKSSTVKVPGPLHPLPVPDKRFDSVAINFMGPVPVNDGFDAIVTMTDQLGANIQITPCNTNMTAKDFAVVFFKWWYCKNGCPLEIISNQDNVFISKFWRELMRMTGVKHKLSTVYHPETDGSSERPNKTVMQCLCYHVEHNQKGGAKALPKVHFDIMNTVNMSMQVSPFVLKTRRSPRVLPPFISSVNIKGAAEGDKTTCARDLMSRALVKMMAILSLVLM